MAIAIWAEHLAGVMREVLARATALLPNILGCLALLAIGWILAAVARALCTRLGDRGLALLARRQVLHARLAQFAAIRTAPRIVGLIIYWFVILFFLTAAAHVIGLTSLSDLVSKFALYLPRVLGAATIVFVGVVVGDIVRGLVARAASGATVAYGEAIGRVVQVAIIIVASMLAVEQLGISDHILLLLFGVVAATTLGGAALAFGLGAGPVVRDILAAHYLRKTYRPGHRVRVAGHEGRILEIHPTHVLLETPGGQVTVPAHFFMEHVSLLLPEGG